ncbi:MAG: hypothetical protein ACHQ52_08725 [Candidatus Eisenbacteria bacterium]
MRRLLTLGALGAVLLAASGCVDDTTAPRDVTPPSPPAGLYSVTGDHQVFLHWLPNPEPDVARYCVYQASCPAGDGCPYVLVGTTGGVDFTVGRLADGVTQWFAVTAVDAAGNSSEPSPVFLQDTPRPAGRNQWLEDYYLGGSPASGWDFSTYAIRTYDDPSTDMFFGYDGSRFDMFVPDYETDIQDAGFASTLDAVDLAPDAGWSPSGSVELIPGHCYVVWTRDDHYAKFRVLELRPPANGRAAQVIFDWAYQIDTGNRELRMSHPKTRPSGPRPPVWPVKRA